MSRRKHLTKYNNMAFWPTTPVGRYRNYPDQGRNVHSNFGEGPLPIECYNDMTVNEANKKPELDPWASIVIFDNKYSLDDKIPLSIVNQFNQGGTDLIDPNR